MASLWSSIRRPWSCCLLYLPVLLVAVVTSAPHEEPAAWEGASTSPSVHHHLELLPLRLAIAPGLVGFAGPLRFFRCSTAAVDFSVGVAALGQFCPSLLRQWSPSSSPSPLRQWSSSLLPSPQRQWSSSLLPSPSCRVWTPPRWACFIQCGGGLWLLRGRGPPCPARDAHHFGLLLCPVCGHACTRGLHASLVHSKEAARWRCTQSLDPASLKVVKGTSFIYFLLCASGSNHGSGKAFLHVRADLRLRSMLVLRFNVKSSRANFLSPVKVIRYLRLKIQNPHRHRPVRQPRGAPVVLSECNFEDPRCFWRGHRSTLAQRLRQKHHLWLLHRKCSFQMFRSLSTLSLEQFNLSHCSDSFVVAQKLHLRLGWKIPILCTLFSSF